MMKRERLKRVTVPNGRRFIARHQHVTRGHLPANLHLTQPYKERAVPKGRRRRWQQGRWIGSKLLRLVKKASKVLITWKIGKMVLNEISKIYGKGISKIKNKKVKKLQQSDLPNSLVGMDGENGW